MNNIRAIILAEADSAPDGSRITVLRDTTLVQRRGN